MSNKAYFHWFVLFMGLVLPRVSGAVTINVAQYANIAVGHGLVYQQSLYPDVWRVEVDSLTIRNGYDVFLLQEYDSLGFKNDQNFISSNFSVALFDVGWLNDYGQPTEQLLYWEPPVPRLFADFTPGQSYPMSGTNAGTAFTGNLTIVQETVTVPVGTFSDTWKVTHTFNDGSQDYVFSHWYAKGMGLVKREEEDGNIWELTGYYGFTFTPVPVPAALWLFGSGLLGLIGFARKKK